MRKCFFGHDWVVVEEMEEHSGGKDRVYRKRVCLECEKIEDEITPRESQVLADQRRMERAREILARKR